jgi:hypothetical protein
MLFFQYRVSQGDRAVTHCHGILAGPFVLIQNISIEPSAYAWMNRNGFGLIEYVVSCPRGEHPAGPWPLNKRIHMLQNFCDLQQVTCDPLIQNYQGYKT